MYAIRVDTHSRLLRVELSGRIRTEETLRAISQSAVLAEASGLVAIFCDITRVERGPGSFQLVAAGLSGSHRPGMRIALYCTPAQQPIATRIARFSGLRQAITVFDDADSAFSWLAAVAGARLERSLRAEAERLFGRSLVIEPSRGAVSHETAPPAA